MAGCQVGNHDLGEAVSTTSPSGEVTELGVPTASSHPGGPHWEAVLVGGPADLHRAPVELSDRGSGAILEMTGLQDRVTVFSDRPQRLAGTMEVHELVTLWAGGVFSEDPPNAAVVSGSDVLAVELTGAVWDPGSSTIWFSIRPLDPDADAALLNEPSAEHTQLFIDGFATPVDDQVTDAVTQSNVKVVGTAPAQGMGLTYQSLADSVGLDTADAQRSAYSEGSINSINSAVTAAAAARILAQDP